MHMKKAFLMLIPMLVCSCMSAATSTQSSGDGHHIDNKFLRRSFSTAGGTLKTIQINNKVAGKKVTPLAAPEFSLRVSEGTHTTGTDKVLTSADFTFVKVAEKGDELVFTLKNNTHKLTVNVHYQLKNNEPYLRKSLEITAGQELCIERIDIDSLKLEDVYQPYKHKAITSKAPWNWKPGLGQPLYTSKTGIFLGTEFPASYNYVKDQNYFCGYQYGHMLKPGKSVKTYSAVLGVGDDSKYISDAFYDYINDIRVRPLRLQTQYNSWFDYGPGVTKNTFRKSTAKIHHELCELRGTKPLKAYVIDDGWQDSNRRSDWSDMVWKVNGKFNKDFAYSYETVKNANSKLGLWLSPGCNFGARGAVPHMRAKGWGGLATYMSLANSPYMDLLEKRMTGMAAQGVNYFKLDGLFGHLNTRDFDLDGLQRGVPVMPQLGTKGMRADDKQLNDAKYDEAKIYYLTVGAERLMKIFKNMGKVNPDVYIVISNGAWLSPWWLMHCDAVWMINAGDAAGGSDRTGELVYRDSVYHNIWKKEQTQFPMCALFNHEPKKTKSNETKDTFRKYLYMNMSRGTGFIELYTKTFNLKDYDWDVMAEGLQWAEDVFPTFSRSRMHGGAPKAKEVYGYTAWNNNRGYVSIHNPSDEAKEYSFTLNRDFGLIPGQKNYCLTSPLSDSLVDLKSKYQYGDTIKLTLQPREIRILNFDQKPKKWSKLKALQERTKADFKVQSVKGHKIIGVWKYKHAGRDYSREFTEDGFCILRAGKNVNWKKSFRIADKNTVYVGKEKHSIQKDGTMKTGRYHCRK